MAVRKPAWDMSRSEIDRRADAVKVASHFERQRVAGSARADSAQSDRAAARKALIKRAQGMTPDQIMEISAAIANGADADDEILRLLARADAALTGDGLICTTTLDASNRPIHEFKSIDGRKRWMNDFKSPAHLQVVLSHDPAWNRTKLQRYLAENPEART